VLRGKATLERAPELLDILRDALLTPRLDNPERFRQIVLEAKAGAEAGLIPGGHQVTNSRLRAQTAGCGRTSTRPTASPNWSMAWRISSSCGGWPSASRATGRACWPSWRRRGGRWSTAPG
jgi:hypothetical protein